MMAENWFDPNLYAWIPGTVYGCAAGIMGGVVAWLVPRGKARSFILNAWATLWLIAVAMLFVGTAALLMGQPWGVWYALLLPGAIGFAVVGGNFFVILKAYRSVEQRRLAALDLG
jgi:hypothetical protein